jgi:hypothetical protein
MTRLKFRAYPYLFTAVSLFAAVGAGWRTT